MKIKPIIETAFINVILLLILLPGKGFGQITEITFQPFKQFILVGQTKELTFVVL